MSVSYYYNLGKNKLFKLNRSLTGKDTLKTLHIIKNQFSSFKIKKIKSGTKVFDWKVPAEWNVSDAYIKDKNGKKIINIKKNNLHLVGYSKKVKKIFSKNKLFENLHFLKNQPNAIPYITSYYKKTWGFCLSYNQFKVLNKTYKPKDKFKVVVDTKFNQNGYLNYGEIVIGKKNHQEILISTYICHPSMANNELSGPIVSMSLINYFQRNYRKLNKCLRFIFIPETIGSIIYLNKNLKHLKKKVIGGYNLTCIGDNRSHSCMFSKYQNSPSDESIIEAYKKLNIKNYKIHSFLERGSDERQYNSPGIDLPISSIFRTKYLDYPEYHTSLDDFGLVTKQGLEGGFKLVKKAISILDKKIIPKYTILCEPHMSKRGLYPTLSKKNKSLLKSQKLMDFLQYSDGKSSLEKISKNINLSYKNTKAIYYILKKNNLIK